MDTPGQAPFSKSLFLYVVLAVVAQFLVDRTLEALDALFSVVQFLTSPLTAVYTLIPPLPSSLAPVLLGTMILLLACAVVTALLLCGHVVEFVIDDEGSLLVDVIDCPDPVPPPPPPPLPYPHCIGKKPHRPQLPLITITPPPLSELELRDLHIRQAVEERDRIRWKVELSWLRSNEDILAAADPKAYREAYKKVRDRAFGAPHVLRWNLWTVEDWTYRSHPKTLEDIQSKADYGWAITAIEQHRLALEARKAQVAERLRLKEEEWAANLNLLELPQRLVEVAGEESSGPICIDLSRIHQEESRDHGDEVDVEVIAGQQDPTLLDGRAIESTVGTTPVNPMTPTIPPSAPLQSAHIAPVMRLIRVEPVSSNHNHGAPSKSPDRPKQSHSDASTLSPYIDGPSTPLRSHPPSSTSIIPSPSCACTGRSHRRCGFATPLPGLSDSSDFGDESDTSDAESSSSLPTSPILEPKHHFEFDEAADNLCDLFHGFSLSPARDVSLLSFNPQTSDCAPSDGKFPQAPISTSSPILRPLNSPSPSRSELVASPPTSPVAFEPSADIFSLAAALGPMPLAASSEVVQEETRMDDDVQMDQMNPAFIFERREPTAMDGIVAQQPIPQSTLFVEAPPSIFTNFQFAINIPPQNVVPATSSWQYPTETMDVEPVNSAHIMTDLGDDDNDGNVDFVRMITDQMTQADTTMSMAIDANEILSCLPSYGLPVTTVLTEQMPMDINPGCLCPVETLFVAPNSVVDVQMAEDPSVGLPILVPTDPALLPVPDQLIAMEFQITPPIPSRDLADTYSSLHSDVSHMGGMDASSGIVQLGIPEQLSSLFAPTPSKSGDAGSTLHDVATTITPSPLQPSIELHTTSETAVVHIPVEEFNRENQKTTPETVPGPSSASCNEEIHAKERPGQLPKRRLKLVMSSSPDLKDAIQSRDDNQSADPNIRSGLTVSAVHAVALGDGISPALSSTSQAVDSSVVVAPNALGTSNLLRLRTKRGSLLTAKLPQGKAIPKTQAKFAEPGELVYVEEEKKNVPKSTQTRSPSDLPSLGTTAVTPAILVPMDSLETNSPQASDSVISSPPGPQIGTVAVPTAWSQSVKSINSRFLTRKEKKTKVVDEEAELAEFLASRAKASKTHPPGVPIVQAASSRSNECPASLAPIESVEVKRPDTRHSSLEDVSPLEGRMPATPMDTISETRPVRGLPPRAIRKSVQSSTSHKSTIAASLMLSSEIVAPSTSSTISFDFSGGAGKETPISEGPLEGDELDKALTDAFEEIHYQDRTRERRLKQQGGKSSTRR